MHSKTGKGETALELLANKVPSAIDEFMKRLDKGIILDDPENETKIMLDFRKLFSVTEGTPKDDTSIMEIFINLSNSPFQRIVEHPLVKAFLALKLKQVKVFYGIFCLSHLTFSLVFSTYCFLVFARLCPPSEETKETRHDMGSSIACSLEGDRMTATNIVNLSWVFLVIFIPVFVGREGVKLVANVRAGLFGASLRYSAMMVILLLLMIALVYPAGLLPSRCPPCPASAPPSSSCAVLVFPGVITSSPDGNTTVLPSAAFFSGSR